MIRLDGALALAGGSSSDPSYLQPHPSRISDRVTDLAVKAFYQLQRPHSLAADSPHHDVLKPYFLFVSPGAGNVFFTADNMKTLSQPFVGAAELSALPGNDQVVNMGSYSRIGENRRVTIANWTKRVALAFHQMYKMVKELALPKDVLLRWMGHSQGGLVVLAGKGLAKIHARLGYIPDQIKRLFEGLSDLPKHEQDFILPRIAAGEADAFASPLEEFALHPSREKIRALRAVRDFISDKLVGGALHYMQKDFLNQIYDAVEFGPGDLSLQMITDYDRSLSRAWEHGINCSSFISDLAMGVLNTMTIGVSHLIGPHSGDGLVKKPEIHTGNLVTLEGVPFSHVEQVRHPRMPVPLLDTMAAQVRATDSGMTLQEHIRSFPSSASIQSRGFNHHGSGSVYSKGQPRFSIFGSSKIVARL